MPAGSRSLPEALGALPATASILDVGGWFSPLNAATHVVDLMPYETRRAVLSLAPVPGERFDREHWHQVDFLAPGFQLPFADHQFDFVYCGHTVEDLTAPAALLREMRRVGRAGCISSPSRLSEQTRGVRDRMSHRPGHLHHHWIIDPLDHGLRLCDKTASLHRAAACLPLRHFERNAAGRADRDRHAFLFFWRDRYDFEFVSGNAAFAHALAFARAERVRLLDRLLDPVTRRLRALKQRLTGRQVRGFEATWPRILALSRPYSRIPLPPPP